MGFEEAERHSSPQAEANQGEACERKSFPGEYAFNDGIKILLTNDEIFLPYRPSMKGEVDGEKGKLLSRRGFQEEKIICVFAIPMETERRLRPMAKA